ncbi:MAG TPA: hypothetical protein VNO70_10720, partial [Blastocatellia bacterium]|nr:hypothetical protein [Blastocatellia bacterium]
MSQPLEIHDKNVGMKEMPLATNGGAKPVSNATDQSGEIRKLTTLLEISQTLSGTLNLKSALHRVLEILERH